ncbi:MAG TPA: hypothetical protein VGM37_11010 [Armatimonadota bacterium]|jgi:hypothetical protein
MRTHLAVILAMVCLAGLPHASRADAPHTIAFQGVLADSAGAPKANGDYTISFRLFDALTDGNLLWSEADKTVTVSAGHGTFSTLLGDTAPFGALAFDQVYYLEIEVAGEGAPMTPRLPLASVPYALNAIAPAATLSLPFSGSLSTDSSTAITIENTGSGGSGVRSITHSGRALWGTTDGSYGVYAEALTTGIGIQGKAVNNVGVGGISVSGNALAGTTSTGFGVYAEATGSGGGAVRAISNSGRAVWATCTGASYGVYAESNTGIAMNALSNNGTAAAGNSQTGTGVFGHSNTGIGTYGESDGSDGVQGKSTSAIHAGVAGINTTSGFGVFGQSLGGGYAGLFAGRVRVDVLEIAGGADLAEKFETSSDAEPGTVMCIDAGNVGRLTIARGAYNRKVAGVVSGANKLSAGMVLSDPAAPAKGLPVAMTGRVWVKCDASNGPIEPGDLLTTADAPGRAMKVTDYAKAMGASVGKAMSHLESGEGLVLVLVNLQ